MQVQNKCSIPRYIWTSINLKGQGGREKKTQNIRISLAWSKQHSIEYMWELYCQHNNKTFSFLAFSIHRRLFKQSHNKWPRIILFRQCRGPNANLYGSWHSVWPHMCYIPTCTIRSTCYGIQLLGTVRRNQSQYDMMY